MIWDLFFLDIALDSIILGVNNAETEQTKETYSKEKKYF